MDLSIFFARLFGLYFLIFATLWVVFKDQFEVSLRELVASRSFIFFSGVMNLLLGLTIVLLHPHWSWQWQVGVTILGYFALFHGILRCAFVDHVQRFATDMLRNRHWIPLIILFILGAFFTYHGFKG